MSPVADVETPTLSASAGTNNRLSGFGYDAAGNMTSNSPSTYKYDAENRLTTTSGYTYYYDGDGNRVAKSNGSTGTAYWRGPSGDPIFESSLTGTNQEEYIFFNGSRVARRDVATNFVHYYFSDHLGTHGVVVSPTGGGLEQDIDYYPFGGVMSDFSPNVAQHYRFTGKERDTESGLDNFGARYDASSMGRFMTPDPLMASAKVWDPQTWNRYAYTLNNPLKYVDPTGMIEVTADQCAKDKNCVTVNVNVIYDKNANDGKGLTDKQKSDFEKGQLQSAKDQYGNADIHLNVSYSAGTFDGSKVTGIQEGALNVLVSDQVSGGASQVSGSRALSLIDVNSTNTDLLSHEIAHHLMGDMSSALGRTLAKDPTGISVLFDNLFTDVTNDTARLVMNHVTPHLPNYPSGAPMTIFNPQARDFQNRITPQTKPQ